VSKPLEKIWGLTEPLVITPMFEMHRLTIKPGFRCSFHVHRYKWNAFFVVFGELFIDSVIGDNIGGPATVEHMGPGGFTTIGPGVHHQFRTEENGPLTSALEMYYTEPLSEDIIRRNVGGPV
jgi:mannose-6-phosphate isomerase-like protein (cupin superfamily)